MLLSPGQPHASYHKRHLFPFSERVPESLEGPRLRGMFPWTGTWSEGDGEQLFSVVPAHGSPLKVAPLICYDAVFPKTVLSAARQRPELLVNLSNDSWFEKTTGARIHLAVAMIRSVETRTPQIRATNSGISAAIDALGEVNAQTGDGEQAVLVAELRTAPSGTAFFVRSGEWVGPMAMVLWLGLIAALVFRRVPAPAPAVLVR
jgi:apolipoprotein N-acyltransferase